MTRWSDLSPIEQTEAATRLVEGGLTYRAAAERLGTTVGSISRALRRAPTARKRPKTRQEKAGDTRSFWTEERLTEPWAQWSARRKAARQEARQ